MYRFGRPGRVELAAAASGFVETAFSGGGETQISVVRGDVRYVVFDRAERSGFDAAGHDDPVPTSGLIVERGGIVVSAALCRNPAGMAAAAALMPPAPFVRH